METGQLKILLEKYFEGQTTLQEEQALLDFFTGDQNTAEMNPYRQQFMLLKEAREQSVYTSEFEKRLTGLIDEQLKTANAIPRRKLYFRYAAAASIAVLIGLSAMVLVRSRFQKQEDTYSDPQLAYMEVQKTLLYVSHTMNRGIEPLSNVSRINTATGNLEHLKKLDNGIKMLNFVSIINKSSNLKK
jgi:hypothetical protein